ncbi:MAG: metallophosphoesterase family protein [Clostridia bacterium]
MEKIAFIADIHSNIVALEAVLKDIENRNIHRIFCLGDLVLKGSSPCEVVDIIKEKCEVVVKGNCDNSAVYPNSPHKQWYQNKLGKERLSYLDSLPLYHDLYMSGSFIRMFHATKQDFSNRIFDIDSIERKMTLFEDENGQIPDIVLYADIHKQYMQKLQNKTIINIGSVGNVLEFPNYDETITNMQETMQAYYCIIEGEYASKEKAPLSIQFIRVPYDIQKEIELAKRNETPDIIPYIEELTTAKYRKLKK